ncbi:MAG TPA: AbrB/MazE/SpoVT family DNA-binding domain-containing protein [Clostridia bacterium]|nr:AbrB/MazE/SpoVT family DNA-binding domain-containing protein [Clostridia bacterium]
MKSFGIISELDNAGGVKLPDMLLGLYDLGAGDAMEMHLEGNKIIMRKYPPACVFCGSTKDLREYRDKSFCCCCADELKNY